MKKYVYLLYLTIITLFTKAEPCLLTTSGNWSVAANWSCGRVPLCTDIIVIPANYTVTMSSDVTYTCTTTINIYGAMVFTNTYKLSLVDGSSINIYTGGIITSIDNNASQKINIGGGSAEWTGNMPPLVGPTAITSAGIQSTLPIELLNFNSTCINGVTELNWSTFTELNNDYFIIEKSINAYTWDFISIIAGNGTSSSIHTYKFIDNQINNELTYYRLTQVDYSGRRTIYKAIDVNCEIIADEQVKIFPNPSSSIINININSKETSKNLIVQIINCIGEIVYAEKINIYNGKNNMVLNSNLNPGTYILQVSSNNNAINRTKIIIN